MPPLPKPAMEPIKAPKSEPKISLESTDFKNFMPKLEIPSFNDLLSKSTADIPVFPSYENTESAAALRKAEEEAERIAEEARRAEEEAKLKAEEARKAAEEAKRMVEEARKAAEEEKKR